MEEEGPELLMDVEEVPESPVDVEGQTLLMGVEEVGESLKDVGKYCAREEEERRYSLQGT